MQASGNATAVLPRANSDAKQYSLSALLPSHVNHLTSDAVFHITNLINNTMASRNDLKPPKDHLNNLSTKDPTSKPPFFHLPPELSLAIFDLAYPGIHLEIGPTSWIWRVPIKGTISTRWLSRSYHHLMISAQYYNEVITHSLPQATFQFSDIDDLERFARNASQVLRENVRFAVVVGRIMSGEAEWRPQIWSKSVKCDALPNLRNLTLWVDMLRTFVWDGTASQGEFVMEVLEKVEKVVGPSGILELRGLRKFRIAVCEEDVEWLASVYREWNGLVGFFGRWGESMRMVESAVAKQVCQVAGSGR